MRNTIKLSLCMGLVSLLFAYPILAQDLDKEMQKMTEKYAKAYNKEDVKALVAMYTADGVRDYADGRSMKGSAEITAELTEDFSTNDFKVSIQHGKVTLDGDEKATATGTYHLTGKAGTGEAVDRMGNYTNTIVKMNGEWKIVKSFIE